MPHPLIMTDWQTYTDESEIADLIPDTIEIEVKGGTKVYPLKDENGRIITRHLPVETPMSYCKNKDYAGQEEIFACCNIGLKIGEAVIKPPSLGVFSLLEAMGNKFLIDFYETTTMEKFHALYYNEFRAEAAFLCRDNYYSPGEYVPYDPKDKSTHTELDRQTIKYIDYLIEEKGVDLESVEVWEKIYNMFVTSANGFEMLPNTGGSTRWLYGAETFGSIVAGVGQYLNKSFDELIWETPVALIGFSYVGMAKASDAKGVSRPKDPEDARRIRILSYLRERNGMLHPWQIDHPLYYSLSVYQEKHKSAVTELKKLQEAARQSKGIKS
jgi:hypothetical protein